MVSKILWFSTSLLVSFEMMMRTTCCLGNQWFPFLHCDHTSGEFGFNC